MAKTNFKKICSFLKQDITLKKLFLIIIGSMICTFGIHNIHGQTAITEGGVMGLMLLIEHWFGFSPSVITLFLDTVCYLIAFKFLGAGFIKMSMITTVCMSVFYRLWEQLPYMIPDLTAYPLVACVAGGVFVGVGVGLIVRQGGSSSGDDALALTISKLTKWRLSRAYLFTDLVVLLLSLSYIPVRRIVFSLITVSVSSLMIDWIQKIKIKEK